MTSFRTLSTTLILVLITACFSTEALAKKPVSDPTPSNDTSTVLSNKDALDLAKAYLPSFTAVDPEITLNDLKGYILSLNTSDLAVIDSAMQEYLASLDTTPVNQPPAISGTPATTVEAGSNYSFTPTASDPDGDSLSFSVSNLPAWASFDALTGTLFGAPLPEDAGSYAAITITVSDGMYTASLMPFTLAVESLPATGSASLSWVTPSTRADNSPLPLSEIGGYRIYMGEQTDALVPVMDINDHSVTEYTLTGITTGTYYFSVTTYDTEGNESGFSNIVQKSTL